MRTKIILEIIIGLPFWGGLIWIGIVYGWQLPVALFLVIIGVVLQQGLKKHYAK